jgi:hypothetical protein
MNKNLTLALDFVVHGTTFRVENSSTMVVATQA